MNELLPFFGFIVERQRIWKRKSEGMPAPWTSDPILQKYKFCNVYRELDRCTMHLIMHVINNSAMRLDDKIFNIILFRRFNIDKFFGKVIDFPLRMEAYNHYEQIEVFDKVKASGIKLFNEAYCLSQVPYDASFRPKDKHVQILISMNELRGYCAWLTINKGRVTIEEAFKMLKKYKGIGNFLAHQMVVDFSYIRNLFIGDINGWVNVGPGARPAIDYIYSGAPPMTTKGYEFHCKEIYRTQDLLFREIEVYTGIKWSDINYKESYYMSKYLSIHNIQACLCEYRKYLNLQSRTNARKRYYRQRSIAC